MRLVDWNTTSLIVHVFLQDAFSGDPKTGLLFSQSGLQIYTMRVGDSSPTSYTLENITTIGTWSAPSSSAHVRFKEVGTIPGLYELQFPNALLATSASYVSCGIICSDVIIPAYTGIQLDRKTAVKRNTALNNFMVWMEDSGTPGVGKTGLTFSAGTAQISVDGGAFANLTNTVTAVSNGWYKVDLTAAELNGYVIAFKFIVSGARDRHFSILTQQ